MRPNIVSLDDLSFFSYRDYNTMQSTSCVTSLLVVSESAIFLFRLHAIRIYPPTCT